MHSQPWPAVFAAAWLWWGVVLAADDERPPPPPTPREAIEAIGPASVPTIVPAAIGALVDELDDDSFETRESAQRRLGEAGAAAIPALERAAEGRSLELTTRAIRVLGVIGRSADVSVFEAALEALERLAAGKNRSASRRAVAELNGLAESRTRHAVAKFEQLGGRMKKNLPTPGEAGGNLLPESARIQAVLNRNWKGGEAGLIHLTRISGLRTVYLTKSAAKSISVEALEEARRLAPELQFQLRGDAMIGIRADTQGGECVIHGVEPGTPAAKGGVQQQDVIASFNGAPVESFEQVIELTSQLQPGDHVTLEVVRLGQSRTIEFDLADFE